MLSLPHHLLHVFINITDTKILKRRTLLDIFSLQGTSMNHNYVFLEESYHGNNNKYYSRYKNWPHENQSEKESCSQSMTYLC